MERPTVLDTTLSLANRYPVTDALQVFQGDAAGPRGFRVLGEGSPVRARNTPSGCSPPCLPSTPPSLPRRPCIFTAAGDPSSRGMAKFTVPAVKNLTVPSFSSRLEKRSAFSALPTSDSSTLSLVLVGWEIEMATSLHLKIIPPSTRYATSAANAAAV